MEWISVKERFPSEYEDVLVFTDRHFMFQSHWYTCHDLIGDKAWSVDEECGFGRITHWTSLPDPPKD